MTSSKLLTPKELADAIGASESSLRRWVDSGEIRMSRTAGGHRRIPVSEAIQFIRKMGAPLLRPELLGLGELPRDSTGGAAASDDERLFERLRAGERPLAKALLITWYLEGRTLAELFDGPVRGALHRLGELWQHDPRGILIEHQATQICLEAVATMRSLLRPLDDSAPLAIGGAPQGDPYQLPTMMAGSVLFEAGIRDISFGPNTPVQLLADEAIERGAKLVWLSLTAPQEIKPLRASLRSLASRLGKHHIQLILGGRNHAASAPRGMENVRGVASMSELSTLAAGLLVGKISDR